MPDNQNPDTQDGEPALTRTAATGLGLALYLLASALTAPAESTLAAFITLATAFQTSFFMALAALYFDEARAADIRVELVAGGLWAAGCFGANIAVSAFFRAAAESYAAFGLPPVYMFVM